MEGFDMARSRSGHMHLGSRARAGALFVVAVVLAGCGSGAGSPAAPSQGEASVPAASTAASQSAGTCTYMLGTGSFADAEKKAWLEPFAAESGIKMVADERDSGGVFIKTAVDTKNYAFDSSAGFRGIAKEEFAKYFEPLDFNVISKEGFTPDFVTDYWIVTDVAAQVLAYNTDATKGAEPTSWADFFDLEKFPGKRGLENFYGTAYAVALMADGVAPEDLVPYDVPRALKKLETIKDQIVWFTSGSEIQDLLGSGEVSMGLTFNGRAKLNVDDGKPVKVVWDGSIFSLDRAVILKGSPNKDACMQFLAYATSKEHSGKITEYLPYPPANSLATNSPAFADWLPRLDVVKFVPDYDYWDASFDELDPEFQQFMTQ
jgi:putative spermidine/putrescine transport system substrate-binding protein